MDDRCYDMHGLVHLYDRPAELSWCMADPRTWVKVRRNRHRQPPEDVPVTCVFCLWLATKEHR